MRILCQVSESGLFPLNRAAVNKKIIKSAARDPIATDGTGRQVHSKRSSAKILINTISGVVKGHMESIIGVIPDKSAPKIEIL